MKVTIHARRDDASALALAELIAAVRPAATIDVTAADVGSRPTTVSKKAQPGPGVLSIREALVMNRFNAGRTVAECAAELGVSAATVQVYAARARSKLAISANGQ
jgi:DNA-binding NarL/FixJ family response regulator